MTCGVSQRAGIAAVARIIYSMEPNKKVGHCILVLTALLKKDDGGFRNSVFDYL